MSRFVRDSQLRNLVVESEPLDRSYTEIVGGDVPCRGGDLIASSARYIAFVTDRNSNNGIGVIPVGNIGKQQDLTVGSTQQGGVYDLKFSPHDPNVFASGAGNGTVAIWNITDDENNNNAKVTAAESFGSSTGSRIQSVQWNPSANGVISCSSDSTVEIWDAESSKSIFQQDIKSSIMSTCWDAIGGTMACLNEDKSMKLIDPRQDTIVANVEGAHKCARPLGRVVCGGASSHGQLEHMLFTTGQTLTRDRELASWDMRELSKPLVRTKIGSGTGIMIPLVVPDTKILFLVCKGETSVRAFEPTSSSPFIYNISQTATSSNEFLGVSSLPVGACDYMSCEVSRLFKLSRSLIEPIRIEIPRRDKSSFHEEIFPPTADIFNAKTSSSDWQSGTTEKQEMKSVIDISKVLSGTQEEGGEGEEAGGSQAQDGDDGGNSARDDTSSSSSSSSSTPAPAPDVPKVYEESQVDKRMSKLMGYVPKFKYARSKPLKKDDTVFNMTVGPQPCLAVSDTKYAVPWQGGGGPIFVGDLSKVGKIPAPQEEPVLNGHTRPVFCLEFNPFDEKVLVSGSDDCHIVTWRLGDQDDNAQAVQNATSQSLSGHQSSVRFLKFHPSAGNLVASASPDSTVRLWDISKGSMVSIVDYSSSETLTSIDWNYDGSQLVSMDRNNAMYIADPRQASESNTSSVEKTHQGAKPCHLCWLGESTNILTSGCARMGYREFKVWDTRSLSEPLSTTKIGTGATSFEPLYVEDNGVVFFVARGENTFHVYEIEGLTRTEIKPDNCGVTNLQPHKCSDYIAPGGTTSAVALMKRRTNDVEKTQVANIIRLTPSTLEPISFTLPRAADLVDYFADDIYCDTRSNVSSLSVESWLDGNNANPVLESMNKSKSKRLSQRDPALAHQALKRAQANTNRFRAAKEAEDRKKEEQDAAFLRMQAMAVQHEQYNPNLSTGRGGHDTAFEQVGGGGDDDEDEVADDEW